MAAILQDINGNLVAVADNKLRVIDNPYLYMIAEGVIANHSEFELFGYNGDIDIAEEDIWNVGGSYAFPAAEQQMVLASDSVEDDPDKGGSVAGTGIHTLTLYYLEGDGTAKTEVVTLNGTADVTTSSSKIYRVQAIKARTVGTAQKAVGNITIKNSPGKTITYSQISAGYTRSRNAIYTVPIGKTLYLTSMFAGCAAAAATTALCTLRASFDHATGAATTGGFLIPHAEVIVGSGGGGLTRNFELPIRFPALVDVKVSASTTANNTGVSIGLRGWIE